RSHRRRGLRRPHSPASRAPRSAVDRRRRAAPPPQHLPQRRRHPLSRQAGGQGWRPRHPHPDACRRGRVGAMARYENILDLIGNTPLVDISSLSPNPRVAIVAKLEGWNPGGSVKDRAAKAMVDEAEKDGSLRPGQQIIESSSGNTGIALAMIARVKG